MKKVYFAGSIRGGRVDASLYREIIEYIQKTDIVLTEHVGVVKVDSREYGQSEEEIYLQDTGWLKESDLLIGEVSCPSLGVGYELAYAERFEKPCYLFVKDDVNLSAMLTGDAYFHIYRYATKEDIFAQIDQILGRE